MIYLIEYFSHLITKYTFLPCLQGGLLLLVAFGPCYVLLNRKMVPNNILSDFVPKKSVPARKDTIETQGVMPISCQSRRLAIEKNIIKKNSLELRRTLTYQILINILGMSSIEWFRINHFVSCLPINQSRISCVPAPISYSLASLSSLPVGYSLIQPLPPSAWMASRATSVPHLEAKQITLAQSKFVRWPLSTIFAQLQSMALEACSLVYISAILPCISWKDPIGWPNWVLVFRQSWVISKADCMIPTGPAASTNLSQSSPLIRTYTPLLICPSTFSSGTYTFSKTNQPVLEPRMPSLSSFWATENPLKDFSTRKVVIPLSLSSGLVFAQTTITSASGPFVIHIFEPFRIYLLPFFSALSFIEVTSEPAPGSDIAKAPICSPEHNLGKYFCFCSSVPCLAICPRQRAVCAPYESPMDPLALDISSMIIECAVQLRSDPPYCEGTVAPKSPISPNSRQR